MKAIPFLFLFAIACGKAQADPPKDFHDYTDPDAYCHDAGYGTAIGWSEPNPWTDTLLCLNDEGLREITAPRSGGGATTVVLVSGTASIPRLSAWTARTADEHVLLTDAVGNGCKDGSAPFAVIPTEADVYQTGATITRGLRLCSAGSDLIVYRDTPSGAVEESFRIQNATVIR